MCFYYVTNFTTTAEVFKQITQEYKWYTVSCKNAWLKIIGVHKH